MSPANILASALIVASLGMPAAFAQGAPRAAAQPAPAATPGDAPDRTSAAFGDWTVQCVTRPAGAGRICEMAQTTQDQRQQTVAVLALGRVAKDQPLRVVARVPVNVTVATPARLALDGGGAGNEPIALPFRTCSPLGCFAEHEMRDEAALRRWRARPAEQGGKLEWRDATGAEAGIPVSFRGFAAAYEALSRESN